MTFTTAQRQFFFRHERWALALQNTIERYSDSYALHDFVIMPDHLHLLLSPVTTLEKAAQLIKGGFSFNARRAFEWNGDVWQAGFADHRIRDARDWQQHVAYIAQNVASLRQAKYQFCGGQCGLLMAPCPPWLKPNPMETVGGGAEAPPFQNSALLRERPANVSSTAGGTSPFDSQAAKKILGDGGAKCDPRAKPTVKSTS